MLGITRGMINMASRRKSLGAIRYMASVQDAMAYTPSDRTFTPLSNINPEDISLNRFEKAQLDYAKLFLERITDRSSPILDIGCGMGGLSNMLFNEDLTPVALTPDISQFKYIEKNYPHIKLIRGKFEELDVGRYADYFGTVITSESLQYLKLDGSLDIINKILKKGGEWLVCDYFRKKESFEKSGHYWDTFLEKTKERGFVVIMKRISLPIYW